MAQNSTVTIERRGDWHPALTDPTNRFYDTAVSRQLGPDHMDLLLDGQGFRLGLSDEQVIGYEILMAAGFTPSRNNDLVLEATEIGYAQVGE